MPCYLLFCHALLRTQSRVPKKVYSMKIASGSLYLLAALALPTMAHAAGATVAPGTACQILDLNGWRYYVNNESQSASVLYNNTGTSVWVSCPIIAQSLPLQTFTLIGMTHSGATGSCFVCKATWDAQGATCIPTNSATYSFNGNYVYESLTNPGNSSAYLWTVQCLISSQQSVSQYSSLY